MALMYTACLKCCRLEEINENQFYTLNALKNKPHLHWVL